MIFPRFFQELERIECFIPLELFFEGVFEIIAKIVDEVL